MTDVDATPPEARPAGRSRRVLAGIALVLACIAILASTIAVWTHQVALNTDRFTSVVSETLSEPAVIDPLAERISSQVITGLDVEGRITDRLPDAVKSLAGPMTLAIQEGIDRRLQVALLDPRVQAALNRTVSAAHAGIVRLLRSNPEAVTVENGYIVVSIFPILQTAIEELQSAGILPVDIQLPDLASPEEPRVLAGRLASALGVSLPDDFGTIQLMKADRLLAARGAVEAFDIIVVALLILTVILIVLAVTLSTARLRMLVYLGLGTIIAFGLARVVMNGIENLLLSGLADDDLLGAIRAVLDATVANLRTVTLLVLIGVVIITVLAVIALIRGRDASIGRDLSIERIGLLAIAFVVIWLAIGPEFALLSVALIVGLELIVGARRTGSPDATTPNGG
jgi:hypothetical protein